MPVVLSGMSGRPRGGAFPGPGPEPAPGWRSDGDGSAAVPGILPSRLQHHIHTAMCLRLHFVLIPSSRAGLISEKSPERGFECVQHRTGGVNPAARRVASSWRRRARLARSAEPAALVSALSAIAVVVI